MGTFHKEYPQAARTIATVNTWLQVAHFCAGGDKAPSKHGGLPRAQGLLNPFNNATYW